MFTKIKNAAEKEFDAVLLVSPVNRRYITGFKSSAGFVIVKPESTYFITDFRYFGAAKGKCLKNVNVILQDKAYEQINELIKNCKNVLVEEEFLSYADYMKVSEKLEGHTLVCGASEALNKLRSIKDKSEVEKITKAQKITDLAFEYIVGFISDELGKLTETDVAAELEYFMKKKGAEDIAFETIAVSGAKSAMPHGVPEAKLLSKGFLTMDFGAKYDGYCSDMTRTICIGKPDEKMRHVYETVLNAQLLALDFISAGKTGRETDAVAREYIKNRGYEGRFGHSLGHSLGLEIHESPNFSPSNEDIIPCGSVLSVEPGVYLDGEYGVRIEDIVNITQNGCINLTKSTKELIIL